MILRSLSTIIDNRQSAGLKIEWEIQPCFFTEVLMGQAGINILADQALPANAKPIAQAFVGHQFGYFTMLGADWRTDHTSQ